MTADNQSNDTEESAADTTTEATAEQQREPVKGPGKLLKEAREQKNLSAQEVADRLRLRLQIIELLEADEYSSFSTPTFIKGYLRSYAKLLDVNNEEIFAAYRKLGIEEPDTTAMQSFSRRVKHQESDNRLMLITYAVIIVVIALVIWWWQDSELTINDISSDVQEAEQPVSEQDAEQPQTFNNQQSAQQNDTSNSDTTAPEPLLESDVEASDASTSLSANDPNQPAEQETPESGEQAVTVSGTEQPDTTLAAVNEPAPATEDNSAAATQSTAADQQQPQTVTDDTASSSELAAMNQPVEAEAEPELVFEFSEECWIKVDDASGETQAIGVKAAGYTMPVPGEAPFSVTICKPEAANISYQGETVDLSNFRRARVARFSIPLSN